MESLSKAGIEQPLTFEGAMGQFTRYARKVVRRCAVVTEVHVGARVLRLPPGFEMLLKNVAKHQEDLQQCLDLEHFKLVVHSSSPKWPLNRSFVHEALGSKDANEETYFQGPPCNCAGPSRLCMLHVCETFQKEDCAAALQQLLHTARSGVKLATNTSCVNGTSWTSDGIWVNDAMATALVASVEGCGGYCSLTSDSRNRAEAIYSFLSLCCLFQHFPFSLHFVLCFYVFFIRLFVEARGWGRPARAVRVGAEAARAGRGNCGRPPEGGAQKRVPKASHTTDTQREAHSPAQVLPLLASGRGPGKASA